MSGLPGAPIHGRADLANTVPAPLVRFVFNLSGVHRCNRCQTMFPYTPCLPCDTSHECVDGWWEADESWGPRWACVCWMDE